VFIERFAAPISPKDKSCGRASPSVFFLKKKWKKTKINVAIFLGCAKIISNLASLAGQVFTLLHYPLFAYFPHNKKQPALYLPREAYRLFVFSKLKTARGLVMLPDSGYIPLILETGNDFPDLKIALRAGQYLLD
jgi:hypothetical protein